MYRIDGQIYGDPADDMYGNLGTLDKADYIVAPPELEETVGEYVYRLRREAEIWLLFFRHVLASVWRLATSGSGRRWNLTSLGEQFLAAPAPLQVWLLLVTWWTGTYWAIAAPHSFYDGFMPAGFSRLALKHLFDLPWAS
jgi:hypothetical protein